MIIEQVSDTVFTYFEVIGDPEPNFLIWLSQNLHSSAYSIKEVGSSLHVVQSMLKFEKVEDALAFKLTWISKDRKHHGSQI